MDKDLDIERRAGAKTRKCLMCRGAFQSGWAGERVCRKCKATAAWRGAYTSVPKYGSFE